MCEQASDEELDKIIGHISFPYLQLRVNMNTLATMEDTPPNPHEVADDKVVPFTPSRPLSILKEEFTNELTTHHRDLLVYARSIVFDTHQARDIVQEAALTAWHKFSDYDAQRADFGTWVRGILRNKMRDWAKSKKGGKRSEVALDDAHLEFLEHHFSSPQEQPNFSLLKACLAKLSFDQRKVIQLTYYQGYKGEEASQELGIHPATLRKRLSRVRLILHDCIIHSA